MKCLMPGCPGEMEERLITHTFRLDGKAIVVEDIPAHVCPICGYTVLDLHVLNALLALDPDAEKPIAQAPVFRLTIGAKVS